MVCIIYGYEISHDSLLKNVQVWIAQIVHLYILPAQMLNGFSEVDFGVRLYMISCINMHTRI